MDRNLRHLLEEIQGLEGKVAVRLRKMEKKFLYSILDGKVAFDPDTKEAHKARRVGSWRYLLDTPLTHLLVAPVVYAFVVPALILDGAACVYQALVFPAFSIGKVKRSDFISFDRGKLLYLNRIERLNCDYCAYVNGLVAFVRELAARSEQYFCPIRHAIRTLGLNQRHHYFLPYGDAAGYRSDLKKLQERLHKAGSPASRAESRDRDRRVLDFSPPKARQSVLSLFPRVGLDRGTHRYFFRQSQEIPGIDAGAYRPRKRGHPSQK